MDCKIENDLLYYILFHVKLTPMNCEIVKGVLAKAPQVWHGTLFAIAIQTILIQFSILLGYINFLQIAILRFLFNIKLLPTLLSSMFERNNMVHSYSTRQSSNLHDVNSHTTLANKSIRHRGPDEWNTLPNDIRNIKSSSPLKELSYILSLHRYKILFTYI